ncbi:MAG TPA: alanine--glyoxylate aminotransferase family protein [Vicinamibacterales bacterium]|nr:alanine--glyoxylate aminotransferase family protein [Vicinamibacterales bacterium]
MAPTEPTSANASTSARAAADQTAGRLLLGPGPSPVAPRVMHAMQRPVLSHLDPDMMAILDDMRARLRRLFKADEGAFAFAVSGTGTAGMETAVANLARPGARAIAVVTGYFGDRLAQMLERHGAQVSRVTVEWGRACDPAQLEHALAGGADLVTMVHAETSTGVLNPVAEMCRAARAAGARTIVDAVTSFGAHPVDAAAWGADVVYSCSQKGLGAPSGLAPVMFTAEAIAGLKAAGSRRSFYLDLGLLQDYWIDRKYHHTISAPLIHALHEALVAVEEEGLEPRWERHRVNHLALVDALGSIGLELLPPPAERLWSLNAVKVPEGVDEAAVRKGLLQQFGIEIGAGLGPLAGKIWRVGLMGSGSTSANVSILTDALRTLLRR